MTTTITINLPYRDFFAISEILSEYASEHDKWDAAEVRQRLLEEIMAPLAHNKQWQPLIDFHLDPMGNMVVLRVRLKPGQAQTHKIQTIKYMRVLKNLSLYDAKNLVDDINENEWTEVTPDHRLHPETAGELMGFNEYNWEVKIL